MENITSENEFINYYKILQCDRTASDEELRRSYQRLLLSSHPDKTNEESAKQNFYLIQKAWSVLKDSQSRKHHDAVLSCQEHSDFLLYDIVYLTDLDLDSGNEIYTYKCRCGGTYILNVREVTPPIMIISCDECSFSIQVNIN